VPVHDPRLRERLQEVLDLSLADDTLAWTLDGDGAWHKVPTTNGVNAQARLQELAFDRARRRPAERPVPVTGA
jgi:polyphosphate kinase